MRLLWRREDRFIGPACLVSPGCAESETAKDISCEIFHTWPAGVDDMIQRRLAENSRMPGDGLWPAAFCLIEYRYR